MRRSRRPCIAPRSLVGVALGHGLFIVLVLEKVDYHGFRGCGCGCLFVVVAIFIVIIVVVAVVIAIVLIFTVGAIVVAVLVIVAASKRIGMRLCCQ